jgi:hypothetical protein
MWKAAHWFDPPIMQKSIFSDYFTRRSESLKKCVYLNVIHPPNKKIISPLSC